MVTFEENVDCEIRAGEGGDEIFRSVHVALADPTDDNVIELLGTRTNLTIKPMVAGPRAIVRAIERARDRSSD